MSSLSQTHQVQSSELKDLTGELLIVEGGNKVQCDTNVYTSIQYDQLWISYTGEEDVEFTIIVNKSRRIFPDPWSECLEPYYYDDEEFDFLNGYSVSQYISWDAQNNRYIVDLYRFIFSFVDDDYPKSTFDISDDFHFLVTVHAEGYNDLSGDYTAYCSFETNDDLQDGDSPPNISDPICSDLSAFIRVNFWCSANWSNVDSPYNYNVISIGEEYFGLDTYAFERQDKDYYVTVSAHEHSSPTGQSWGNSFRTLLIPARECGISISRFQDNEPQSDYFNYCCGHVSLDEGERVTYGEKESFAVVEFNQWRNPHGSIWDDDDYHYGNVDWNFNHQISIDGKLVEDQYGYNYFDYPISCVVDLLPYGNAFGGERHIEVIATDGYSSLSVDTVLTYHPIDTTITYNSLIIDVNSGLGGFNLFVDGEEVELSSDGPGTPAHIYTIPRLDHDYTITVQVSNNIYKNVDGILSVVYTGMSQETTILVPARQVFDFEVDGVYYKVTDDNENVVEVVHGEETYQGVVVVPNTVTYDGVAYNVTGIGYEAFANAEITHLVLPVTITSIDNTAFTNCHIGSLVITGNGTWTAGALATDVDQLFVMSGVTGIQGMQVNPETIYSYSTVPPTCNGQTFTGYDGELHVPASSLASYFTAPYWTNFINITGDAVEPLAVTLNKDSVNLLIGNQLTLTAVPAPTNTTPGIIFWSSSDKQVATVNNGEITAVGVGECDIKAILLDKVATCHVTVTEIVPTELTLNQEFAKLEVGSQLTLTATIMPEDATDKVVTWTTTNAAVATVDGQGNVTAVGPGECTITATCRGLQATCHVVVVEHLIFITLDQHEANLLPNHILLLTPSVSPVSTDLVVTSSNPAVAAARMANGKIQVVGITEGVTTITVNSTDGYAEGDSCVVTVYTERGDLNMDGFVNMDDLTVLINYLLTNNPEGINIKNAADCDGHAGVSMDDLTALINYLLTNQWPVDPDEPVEPEGTQTITVNGVSFKMVPVESGSFMMGATAEQGDDAYNDEKPAHEVTLSSFYIGQTEVTQALWQAVMGNNPSYFPDDPNRPVEMVSWNDCQAFITQLNLLTGKQFRMPTEAEWEYAARGGNKSQGYKYSGSNDIDEVCWYEENSDSISHVVATKAPNELGIYDMTGNVWEWCQDWYARYTAEAQVDPTGPETGTQRVFRGGSWYSSARYSRVSYRDVENMTNSYNRLGLRLVLDNPEI